MDALINKAIWKVRIRDLVSYNILKGGVICTKIYTIFLCPISKKSIE